MRALIALIGVIYFIGVGVVLAPTIQTKWNGSTAADLTTSVAQALPTAFAWPAAVVRGIAYRG